ASRLEYRRRSKLMSRLRAFAARARATIFRSCALLCRLPSLAEHREQVPYLSSRTPIVVLTKRVVRMSGSTYKESMLRVRERARPLPVFAVMVAVIIFAA